MLTHSDPKEGKGREGDRPREGEGGRQRTHSEGRRKALLAVVFVVSLHATQRPFAEGDSDTMGAERRGETLKGSGGRSLMNE